MSLDDATDPQVDALLTLIKGGVNANLADELGQDAIVGTYNHPRPLAILPMLQLPALSVYRFREAKRRRTFKHIDDVVTFRFEYVTTAASLENLEDRWRLLRAVWKEIVELACDGHHPSVSADADVLINAGFVEVDLRTALASYDFHPDGQTLYPFLRGQLVMAHRDSATLDLSGYDDHESLHQQIRPADLPLDEQPLVEEIID